MRLRGNGRVQEGTMSASADVPGECDARLYLSDDYDDNCCTLRCRRLLNHNGLHRWRMHRYYKDKGVNGKVIVSWEIDERDGS